MTKHIKHSIPGQVSSHIVQDYPLFVEFVSSYYEWLEREGSPYHHIKNHLSYLDFKDSLETYVRHLKNEYLHSVPEKVFADKELMIRYSKQFFQTVGTESSFRFIFKVLYGESVELYYPKNDVLRLSDGTWIANENLMYVSNSGNVESFLYRRITQTREPYPGVFEYARATVNRITNRYAKKFTFSELYVTDIEGEFDLDYPIEVDGKEEWIMPICGDVIVDHAGMNYSTDNRLTYSGDETFDVVVQATEPGIVNARYTTTLDADGIKVVRNGVLLTSYGYDGQYVSHSAIQVGDEITISYPVYEGLVVVDTTRSMGGIDTLNVVDAPFGIVEPQQVDAFEGGSGASLTYMPAVSRKIPGYFFDTKGQLSADKKIQDNDYYQDYSYVIRAGIDIERYKDTVLKLLHPAGLKMIGEVNIIELLKLFAQEVEFVVENKTEVGEAIESSVSLYSRLGYINDTMMTSDPGLYKVGHFFDIRVADIWEKPDSAYNMHDCRVTTE